MTEPPESRPVPGPYRPAPVPARDSASDSTRHVPRPALAGYSAPGESGDSGREPGGGTSLADLEGLPVVEHVAVFETEHARLQRELGTIDRL